jgi:hypothetical protein
MKNEPLVIIGQALQFWECWRRNQNSLPDNQDLEFYVKGDNLNINYVTRIDRWFEPSGEPMSEDIQETYTIDLSKNDTLEKFTDRMEEAFEFFQEHQVEINIK